MTNTEWELYKELQGKLREIEVKVRWTQRMLQNGQDWQTVVSQLGRIRAVLDEVAINLDIV
ncbi:MAG: hypothetical protein HPY81_10725 [Firmicutes bacterium]|nr:hypothetical protein [Bacillota bacterium]